MLNEAGFAEGKIHGWTGYHTSPCTEGALVSARKPAEGMGENDPRLHAHQRSGVSSPAAGQRHPESVEAEAPVGSVIQRHRD
jgi:hypothetical protein